MVDPTKGIGPLQGVVPTNKTQSANTQDRKTGGVENPRDEVSLSDEAISLSQAEETAEQTRVQLANSDESLGLDPNFDRSV